MIFLILVMSAPTWRIGILHQYNGSANRSCWHPFSNLDSKHDHRTTSPSDQGIQFEEIPAPLDVITPKSIR
jgi:hypothetical protein